MAAYSLLLPMVAFVTSYERVTPAWGGEPVVQEALVSNSFRLSELCFQWRASFRLVHALLVGD